MAELVYAVVLGAMSFGLQVRVLSLVVSFFGSGNITQLVECLLCKEKVVGSIPTVSTRFSFLRGADFLFL